MDTLQTPQKNMKPWLTSGAFLALAVLIGFGIFKISGSFLATRAPGEIDLSDTVIGGDLKGEGLQDGTYTLQLLAKTQDGTTLGDTFKFTVGSASAYGPGPDPTVDPYAPLPDPYGPTSNPPLPYGPAVTRTPVPFPTVLPGPYTPALVAYWKFDESAKNIASDSSGNKRVAGLQGGLANGWQLTDKPALNFGNVSAIKFDGYSNYASFGLPEDSSSYVYAFAAWIKTAVAGTQALVVGNPFGNGIYDNLRTNAILLEDGRISVRNGGARACTSSARIDCWKWHHFAVSTGSLNTVTYYVDGVEVKTCTYPTGGSSQFQQVGALFVNSSPFFLGQDYNQTNSFNGSLDDVRF